MSNLISAILNFIQAFFKPPTVAPQTAPGEALPSQPIPEPSTHSTPAPTAISQGTTYLWDTFENAKHSVRVICDEEGLTWQEKEIVAACVMQESGFQTYYFDTPLNRSLNRVGLPVRQDNKENGVVWSTDWGIVQINDYYQCKVCPGRANKPTYPFADSAEILAHPEKAVRFMVQCAKVGNLKLWASYTSGAYKKFLGKV